MEPPLKVSSRYAAGDFVSEGEIQSSKIEKNDTGQQFNANLTKMIIKNDLYGPLMLIFTLVALLLWGMKNSDYKVKDRTLIGTALATATSYWLFASVCLFAFCLYSSSNYSFIGVLSTVGYSMFSHCIVLAITEIVHLLFHSHYFFHFCALTIGSMAAGKLVLKKIHIDIFNFFDCCEMYFLGGIFFSRCLSKLGSMCPCCSGVVFAYGISLLFAFWLSSRCGSCMIVFVFLHFNSANMTTSIVIDVDKCIILKNVFSLEITEILGEDVTKVALLRTTTTVGIEHTS
ncbi:protein YIPF3 [Trichinella spiralis]|uniref:protein YIPF3 n=1 Tax=Trichinella spiralis TaxID=6334 RepID=UPI0001EFC7AE|nr:protein YIPF3 [Trichinella spiralis]